MEEIGGHHQDEEEISQICSALFCSEVSLSKFDSLLLLLLYNNIFSLFCVVSSWASFLITPQVRPEKLFLRHWQNHKNKIMPRILTCDHYYQIVPGRMGLLVTLFLSLTALLVSTINSSPEVTFTDTGCQNYFWSGCWRHYSPGILGSGPLFLHLWSNCGLHDSTDLDKDEQQRRRKTERWWSRCAGLEDW